MALIINVAFDEMRDDSVNKMLKDAYREDKNKGKPLHLRKQKSEPDDDDDDERDNPADLDQKLTASKPPTVTTADMPHAVAAKMSKKDLKPKSRKGK